MLPQQRLIHHALRVQNLPSSFASGLPILGLRTPRTTHKLKQSEERGRTKTEGGRRQEPGIGKVLEIWLVNLYGIFTILQIQQEYIHNSRAQCTETNLGGNYHIS
jgi:hypothetical protein